VASVIDSVPEPPELDPTEAWRFAGPRARERLAHAVTPEGMRERLRETRSLLLAPGAPVDLLARDPLRLSMIPWQDAIELASGVSGERGGSFVAEGGKMRLVAVEAKGRAFDGPAAARFADQTEAAIASVSERGVQLEVTGGHIIARQTERVMKEDLQKSGVVSIVLSAIVFTLTFRRPRALIAVLPPLAAGTLWTTALAATIFAQLSAVATAFAAVVVGVGVDTGVHVYGRLLDARRSGLTAAEAARVARSTTWRPTLGAAFAAALAFACLALSQIEGMRQLGVLCAAGEILTAIAILVVVPDVGAWLERGAPPTRVQADWVVRLTGTRERSGLALAVMAALVVAGLVLGMPRIDPNVAALDARTIPALATFETIDASFGGRRGQLTIVSADVDPARARARSDAIAEALERRGFVSFDALARIAPSPELQRTRLAERPPLDRHALERALLDEGFSLDALQPALEAFDHPSSRIEEVPIPEWLRRRHLAQDREGAIAVTYVRSDTPDVVMIVRGADPSAIITGFAELGRGVGRTIEHDLPRVFGAALLVVVVVLGASLRRVDRVLLAVFVLFVEIVIVSSIARLLGVRWHVYDALVLPVLLGITLDEVLFLLDAAGKKGVDEALREQAPLGTATALTTASGFGALVLCRFDGLVDIGKVGALGSIVGLLVSLVVIPAVFRLRSLSGTSRLR
jgi:uncharacterized protein